MLTSCPVCGKSFVNSRVDPHVFDLPHIGNFLRYEPRCDCLHREREQEITKQQEAQRVKHRREAVERHYQASRLAPALLERSFDQYLPQDELQVRALAICRHYAFQFAEVKQDTPNGLLVYGDSERGKTHLAAALFNVLNAQGKIALLTGWPRVLARFRQSFKTGTVEEEKTPLLECDCLVLDDVGVGSHDEWVINTLSELLDHRLEWHLPTVLTAPADLGGLEQVYGCRVASRIRRMCRLVPV